MQVAACSGDGPIDATFKAINSVIGIDNIKLLSFKIDAITGGTDALGDVVIKLDIDGKTFIGHSAQPDITYASALAYLEAINRYISVSQQ